MRRSTSLVLASVLLLSLIRVGNAACLGDFHRQVVGHTPDLVFIAGNAETKILNPAYSVWAGPFFECGALARSLTPGISVVDSYASVGTVFPPGEWASVSVSAGPGTFRYKDGFEVRYDGSGAAGSRGRIEIAQKGDEFSLSPRLIGTVNVYIVAPGRIPSTWFDVTANSQTMSGDRLIIDHPYLNDQSGAMAFISHVFNRGGAGGGMRWEHPIALVYDDTLNRWAIRNEDSAPMVVGVSFNIRIDPSAMRVTARGIGFQRFVKSVGIRHPSADRNIFATIMVTPVGSFRNPHPVAVKYIEPYWAIVNTDGTDIRVGASFNVKVMGTSSYIDDSYRGRRPFDPLKSNAFSHGAGTDIVGIGPNRRANDNRYLPFFWTSRQSELILLVTPNLNPLGKSVVVNPYYVGVRYTGLFGPEPVARWAVYNESQSDLPGNVRFNLWGESVTSIVKTIRRPFK